MKNKLLISLSASLALSPCAMALDAGVSFDGGGSLAAFSRQSGIPVPLPGLREAAELPAVCAHGAAGSLDGAAFAAAVAASDVVYVGESHDQANDHLAQLEALKALYAVRGAKVAVGFEMLNVTLQPVLDEYASGAITEAEFLKKADWQKEWGFDFNLYKPIFDFIRGNKLSAVALNLPKKVVSHIAMKGLDALPPEEAAYLPADMQVTTNARYIAYIKESFDGHMSDMFKFENYLAAMSAWNEAMGANMAAFLNANKGYAGLVVAGSGHVIYNAAIPASLKARAPWAKDLSFFMKGADSCPAAVQEGDADLADFVWYVPHTAEEEKGLRLPL
ncbi:MAG: ChaN family lipoprotein [Elusimicrobia bacterium]|nr:ChaN family lipoprotein [Elusimicrobiota bacterium]